MLKKAFERISKLYDDEVRIIKKKYIKKICGSHVIDIFYARKIRTFY